MLGGMKGFTTIYGWLLGVPAVYVQGDFKLAGVYISRLFRASQMFFIISNCLSVGS